MIVAWTGHRPDLFRDPPTARAAVESAARDLVDQGVAAFLVGGQRGVDTWAALAAIRLGVPFRLILPFEAPEFTRDWSDADRSVLLQILPRAESVQIAGGYSARNWLLGSTAQLLVAVWTRTAGGGTAETIELARRAGVPIREIVLERAASAFSAVGRGI